MTCSSARYLLLAGFVGVAASSVSGNDLLGVLAAVVAVLGLLAVERFGRGRRSQRTCPVPDVIDMTDRESSER